MQLQKGELEKLPPEILFPKTEGEPVSLAHAEEHITQLANKAQTELQRTSDAIRDMEQRFANSSIASDVKNLEIKSVEAEGGFMRTIRGIGDKLKNLFSKKEPTVEAKPEHTESVHTEVATSEPTTNETVADTAVIHTTKKRKIVHVSGGGTVYSTRLAPPRAARTGKKWRAGTEEEWFDQGAALSAKNEKAELPSAVNELVRQSQDITTADEIDAARVKKEAAVAEQAAAADTAKHTAGKAWVAGDKRLAKTYDVLTDTERDVLEDLDTHTIGDDRNNYLEQLSLQGKISPDLLAHLKKRKDVKLSKMAANAAVAAETPMEDKDTYVRAAQAPKVDLDLKDGELLSGAAKLLRKRKKTPKTTPESSAPAELSSDQAFVNTLTEMTDEERDATLGERALEDTLSPAVRKMIRAKGWDVPELEMDSEFDKPGAREVTAAEGFYARLTDTTREIADKLKTMEDPQAREDLLLKFKGSPSLTAYAKAAHLVSWDFDQDAFRHARTLNSKLKKTRAMEAHADKIVADFDAHDAAHKAKNDKLDAEKTKHVARAKRINEMATRVDKAMAEQDAAAEAQKLKEGGELSTYVDNPTTDIEHVVTMEAEPESPEEAHDRRMHKRHTKLETFFQDLVEEYHYAKETGDNDGLRKWALKHTNLLRMSDDGLDAYLASHPKAQKVLEKSGIDIELLRNVLPPERDFEKVKKSKRK